MSIKGNVENIEWKSYEKIVFRISFVYFVLQVIPVNPGFYQVLFSGQWLQFQNLFQLTAYYPGFTSQVIILVISLISGFVWSYLDRDSKNYNYLYYWLRVLLRYRLALALIGVGLIKLFPIQIPPPTLSDLNTPYGDFMAWKVYYLTTGVGSAAYVSVLGSFEIIAAILLSFRKTTTFGAAIALATLTNIAVANFAYGIGDHIYAVYLFVIALFLFAYDLPRLISLLSRFKFTKANRFRIHFSASVLKTRFVLQLLFLVFTLFYTQRVFTAYNADGHWTFPGKAGLRGAEGYYTVSEFKLRDSLQPYSLVNPERWQNVVFEKWNTLSVRKAMPPNVNFTAARNIFFQQSNNNLYEALGNGGRYFYSYTDDSVHHQLHLTNRLVAEDSLTLAYERPNDSTIVLSGTNIHNDSLHIVLKKINKTYLLKEGRRNPKKRF